MRGVIDSVGEFALGMGYLPEAVAGLALMVLVIAALIGLARWAGRASAERAIRHWRKRRRAGR